MKPEESNQILNLNNVTLEDTWGEIIEYRPPYLIINKDETYSLSMIRIPVPVVYENPPEKEDVTHLIE